MQECSAARGSNTEGWALPSLLTPGFACPFSAFLFPVSLTCASSAPLRPHPSILSADPPGYPLDRCISVPPGDARA